jgi:F-box-like
MDVGVTIGSLPDNVLLDIFDFYRTPSPYTDRRWHALAHVCRRWRYIVFASPLRLNLRLKCNANTPVKKTLDVWPRGFPIIIEEMRPRLPLSGANIIAALEHHDRVSEITLLYTTSTLLKRLYKVMKKPYSVLTCLHLDFDKKSAPVVPDTFMGRSAPQLVWYSILGTTKISSILPRSCRSSTQEDTQYRLRFTRRYGHSPIHVD